MSKNQRRKFHVRKRIFLNRELDRWASAIGIVEDLGEISNENEDGWKSENPNIYLNSTKKTKKKLSEYIKEAKNAPCQDCGVKYPY
jgi:hypothetical protein